MKWIVLVGYLKTVWTFIRPLLASGVGRFLADADVQRLAVQAVERAAKVDLDGDGKFAHATADLRAELARIGQRYYAGWLAVAIQTAFARVQAKAEPTED